MLIYHPMYDLYHCISRLIVLIKNMPEEEYPYQKLQILDFYLLFPSEIKKMSPMFRDLSLHRTMLRSYEDPYSVIQDSSKLIHQLEPILLNALKIIASYKLIDISKLKTGVIVKNLEFFTDEINELQENFCSVDKDIVNFLTGPLASMEFYGAGGLKKRSGLLEYRYDYE